MNARKIVTHEGVAYEAWPVALDGAWEGGGQRYVVQYKEAGLREGLTAESRRLPDDVVEDLAEEFHGLELRLVDDAPTCGVHYAVLRPAFQGAAIAAPPRRPTMMRSRGEVGQLAIPSDLGDGPLVVAYGGGVNTAALLILLWKLGRVPRAIVMADPGAEYPETHWYRDAVMNPWLRERGFPEVTVVTLAEEAKYRPRASKTPQGTLFDECVRIKALPSIAYGWKKCSQKHKARPSRWWTERQPWAREAFARGERIVRCIGYDLDEDVRAKDAFMDEAEARMYVPWYPLREHGYDRDACERLILSEGFPLPHKSACMWCPSNKLREWISLRERGGEGWRQAMQLSQNAAIESPDVVGLMRCNPKGKRQLHLYVFPEEKRAEACEGGEDTMPCECGL